MKKLFAILAVMGVLSFGMTQTAMAQPLIWNDSDSYGSGFYSYSRSGTDRTGCSS